MACFNDTPYNSWPYQILRTVAAAADIEPVGFGCFDAMPDVNRLYQFYAAFNAIGAPRETITENCFVQMTEDMQMQYLNGAIAGALTPPIL
jgi:hypothetical protein